jgi:hypothetical protein
MHARVLIPIPSYYIEVKYNKRLNDRKVVSKNNYFFFTCKGND